MAKAGRSSSPHASDRARRRRIAAEHRVNEARVLVIELRDDGTTPTRDAIRALGYETIRCATVADALRESATVACDVILAVLPEAGSEQLSLLQLLRRTVPATPIVLVSADGSLASRARYQPIRPFYFAVTPIAEAELRAILDGATASTARG